MRIYRYLKCDNSTSYVLRYSFLFTFVIDQIRNTHTHTHTHIYIYIYIYICSVCVYVCVNQFIFLCMNLCMSITIDFAIELYNLHHSDFKKLFSIYVKQRASWEKKSEFSVSTKRTDRR